MLKKERWAWHGEIHVQTENDAQKEASVLGLLTTVSVAEIELQYILDSFLEPPWDIYFCTMGQII